MGLSVCVWVDVTCFAPVEPTGSGWKHTYSHKHAHTQRCSHSLSEWLSNISHPLCRSHSVSLSPLSVWLLLTSSVLVFFPSLSPYAAPSLLPHLPISVSLCFSTCPPVCHKVRARTMCKWSVSCGLFSSEVLGNYKMQRMKIKSPWS